MSDDSSPESPSTEVIREGWPVKLRGVTESVVTTLGPNGLWNVAALGLFAPDEEIDVGERTPIRARTWGNTRTRRNFHREGGGVVQFTSDPREFADATLTIREEETPVLPGADAWVRVTADRVDGGTEGETRWEEWKLQPVEGAIVDRRPFTVDRAFAAVIEATVAASRLDVDAYDEATMLDRLRYFHEVVEKCGGPRTKEAMETVERETGWRDRIDG